MLTRRRRSRWPSLMRACCGNALAHADVCLTYAGECLAHADVCWCMQIAEFDALMLRERTELEAQRNRVATLQSVVVDKERLEAQVALKLLVYAALSSSSSLRPHTLVAALRSSSSLRPHTLVAERRRGQRAPRGAGGKDMVPHTTICVLMLLYMCPHTTMRRRWQGWRRSFGK